MSCSGAYALEELVKKYHLRLLLTFGSYGTERFGKDSDIDVAYESLPELSRDEEISLLSDLILYFKRDKIDLVNLKKAEPLLLFEIARRSHVLYETEDSFLNFKMRASFRYADTGFLRKARRVWLNKQLESKR